MPPAEKPAGYLWSPSASPYRVQLAFDVVDRILLDVMRGFASIPKRGAEVGGVLLGRVDGDLIEIEDFEAVPCQYRFGPSYLLSDRDREQFRETVGRKRKDGLSAVGYYRSNTREEMTVAPEDIDLLDHEMPEPSAAALLIKPFATQTGVAGFFFRADGQFNRGPTAAEFQFLRKDLGGGRAPRSRDRPATEERVAAPIAAPVAAPVAVPLPAAPAPPVEHRPAGIAKSVLAAVAFVALGVGAGAGFWAAQQVAPYQIQAANDLSLEVQPSGDSLEVRWNPDATAVRQASHGMLHITEGGLRKSVALDTDQLRTGFVNYRGVPQSATVMLEVSQTARHSVRESLNFTLPANQALLPCCRSRPVETPVCSRRNQARPLTPETPPPA